MESGGSREKKKEDDIDDFLPCFCRAERKGTKERARGGGECLLRIEEFFFLLSFRRAIVGGVSEDVTWQSAATKTRPREIQTIRQTAR